MLMLAKFVFGNKENTMLKQQFISCRLIVNMSLVSRSQTVNILMT